ncbi:membrane dipeptidase [Flammeovirga aprica]|uniref:Peptidase M19 n=1 Tax=Flammeovirga aprica JL-4 TaxID=694437 RepID=A0A7X9RZT3_9BACT|nr:membrane dipeptidase [Flammeovirga aprica]NME71807.1 peptidase M19 [Flammeovirga aprica JL-4]
MNPKYFVDFHCHPALKPLGNSFNDNRITGRNNQNHKKNNSIYHQIRPNVFKKVVNLISTLTKFTQTDLMTLAESNVQIISASMYPIEKGFLNNRFKKGVITNTIGRLAMGVGKRRIGFIQDHDNYFKDLELEYEFYKELDNKVVTVRGKKVRYLIVNNFKEIEQKLSMQNDIKTVFIVLSIEGLHSLNTGLSNKDSRCNPMEVKANIETIKGWDHKVLYATVAHHFWNELCGHANSLNGFVDWITDQQYGMDRGITALGYEVIDKLLSKQNGHRILIDVKHMNYKSRNAYYDYLEQHYPNENIPIIVSHGALNGLKSYKSPVNANTSGKNFLTQEINFYDNEIVKIAKSNGLFCFQLDERRLIKDVKNVPKSLTKRGMLKNRSKLLWNQIQHFVEILDREGFSKIWNYMAIGSDYDGIINPLSGFWTAKEIKSLYSNLVMHAENYLNGKECLLKQTNKIEAITAIDKIFRTNALQFLEKNLKTSEVKKPA